jgi:hypothetical protein
MNLDCFWLDLLARLDSDPWAPAKEKHNRNLQDGAGRFPALCPLRQYIDCAGPHSLVFMTDGFRVVMIRDWMTFVIKVLAIEEDRGTRTNKATAFCKNHELPLEDCNQAE